LHPQSLMLPCRRLPTELGDGQSATAHCDFEGNWESVSPHSWKAAPVIAFSPSPKGMRFLNSHIFALVSIFRAAHSLRFHVRSRPFVDLVWPPLNDHFSWDVDQLLWYDSDQTLSKCAARSGFQCLVMKSRPKRQSSVNWLSLVSISDITTEASSATFVFRSAVFSREMNTWMNG